jgi:hypothetical protein
MKSPFAKCLNFSWVFCWNWVADGTVSRGMYKWASSVETNYEEGGGGINDIVIINTGVGSKWISC